MNFQYPSCSIWTRGRSRSLALCGSTFTVFSIELDTFLKLWVHILLFIAILVNFYMIYIADKKTCFMPILNDLSLSSRGSCCNDLSY